MNSEQILEEAEKLKKEGKRARDIALSLNISEAELLAAECDGENVILLDKQWQKLIEFLEKFDKVMTLTRNNAAVLEQNGVVKNLEWNPHAAVIAEDDIDLRIFHKAWAYAYLVKHEENFRYSYSVQIFDLYGDAIHKVYIKLALENVIDSFLTSFKNEKQTTVISVKSKDLPARVEADVDFNKTAFTEDWRNLKDTHDFFGLIRKHKIHRLKALQLVDDDLAWRLENTLTNEMLNYFAKSETAIMIFVGNKGMIQISSGKIKNIKVIDQWLNILDKEFNMHLDMSQITETWAVRKPTEDGDVHSLELYNKDGELMITFFGYRKPGRPEIEEWRNYINSTKEKVLSHA